MNFPSLSDVDLAGKRVFIRADFNVPLNADGSLSDDTRIRAALPGILACREAGAAIMITSHLGRPQEGALAPGDSLAPVAESLGSLLGRQVFGHRDKSHPIALLKIIHHLSEQLGEFRLDRDDRILSAIVLAFEPDAVALGQLIVQKGAQLTRGRTHFLCGQMRPHLQGSCWHHGVLLTF